MQQTTWKSFKQEIAELKEDSATLKKITKLMDKRRKQNTYKTAEGEWTVPDNNIMVSVTELKRIIFNID